MIFLIVKELIICLLITIVIEYIPIVIFLKISKKYFIAVNVLTNVLANVIALTYDILEAESFLPFNRLQLIIVLEIIICISEIFLYYVYVNKKSIKRDSVKLTKNETINEIDIEKKRMILKIVLVTLFANVLSFTIGNKLLRQ